MNRNIIPSFFFRVKGREAMKRALQTLLVLALVAMLPSLISQTAIILTKSDPTEVLLGLNERLTKVQLDSGLTEDALNAALMQAMAAYEPTVNAYLAEKFPFFMGLTVFALLLGPVVMQPMQYGILMALRSQAIDPKTAASRLMLGLKALGISFLSALKAVLWMLPGYGAMLAGALVMAFVGEGVGQLLLTAGTVVAMVMGIQAMLRYSLAGYVLTDIPETGVCAAIRRSKELMANRKMEFFGLRLSYLLWEMLLTMAQLLLIGLLGTVIGMMIALMLNLMCQLYIHCGLMAFYEAYAHKSSLKSSAATAETDGAENLN